MRGTTFGKLWSTYYPGVAPIPWLVRHADSSRWVRFHTLPAAKRYAESVAERSEISHRQAAIAAEMLGHGGAAWLIAWRYEGSDGQWHRRRSVNVVRQFDLQREGSIAAEEPGENWAFYARKLRWDASRFGRLLGAIADDRCACMWLSARNGSLFAPYDGGVDCIVPETESTEALTARFGRWLSARPDGL